MKIVILLATYNSQTFLKEQLDSLVNQSFDNFLIYVRDDGSDDSTLDILKIYCKNYSNIRLLNDPVQHRLSKGSFMWMLEHIEADYYMFCDHDDIWLPDKVKKSLEKIKSIEVVGNPALVCSDLIVVDAELKTIHRSFWEYMKLRPELLVQRKYAVSCNLFTGCTMIINKEARSLSFPISKNALMHDSWIGLRTIANGGNIGWIEEPLILYRQHDSNVCGAQQIKSSWQYYKGKILNIVLVIKRYAENYRMANDAVVGGISLWSFLFYRMIYLWRR